MKRLIGAGPPKKKNYCFKISFFLHKVFTVIYSWNFTVLLWRRCCSIEMRWDTVRSVFFASSFWEDCRRHPGVCKHFHTSWALITSQVTRVSSWASFGSLSIVSFSPRADALHGNEGWFVVISVKCSLFSFLGSRHINTNMHSVLRSLSIIVMCFYFPAIRRWHLVARSKTCVMLHMLTAMCHFFWHSKWKALGLCVKNGKERPSEAGREGSKKSVKEIYNDLHCGTAAAGWQWWYIRHDTL